MLLRRRFYKQESVIIEGNTLTFTAEQANSTIALVKKGSPATINIEYSTNGGHAWKTYTIGNTITLANIGGSVKFRGNNSTFSNSLSNFYQFQMNGKISASGDVTSLLNGIGGDVDLTNKSYCYSYMFRDCTALVTTPELPSTTLAGYCYYGIFQGCTALTTAPVLPTVTLTVYCYCNMFYGCTSLTTAPELPATTMETYCYANMFRGCTSLTTAPELPATTLATHCYQYMFANCTSLTTAPKLPATTLAQDCYDSMFYGCTSLVTAPELPSTTLAPSCYYNMFNGCTSLTTSPKLPATTLINYCYRYMFRDCSNLNYIKAMFTTTPSASYTQSWVSGVAATGIFVKNSAATWTTTGENAVPSGWTVETASE